MTNKVKPFYIKITDDMTPQMVQDAFDKCVDVGAKAGDCIIEASIKHNYSNAYSFGMYRLFGVRNTNSVRLYNSCEFFGSDAKEITLDQLDEWLGIEKEVGWKNGDLLLWKNDNGEFLECNTGRYIGYDSVENKHIFVRTDVDTYYIMYAKHSAISKPETPEQKAERERFENGKAIYDLMCEIEMNHDIAGTPNAWTELRDEWQSVYIKLAERVGYRKQ